VRIQVKAHRDMSHQTFVFPFGGIYESRVCFGVSEVRNVDVLFFMLMWAWCGSPKKHVGTRYAELLFFHPMGSVGHVVRSGASGA
jgi:hypothetical protein